MSLEYLTDGEVKQQTLPDILKMHEPHTCHALTLLNHMLSA